MNGNIKTIRTKKSIPNGMLLNFLFKKDIK